MLQRRLPEILSFLALLSFFSSTRTSSPRSAALPAAMSFAFSSRRRHTISLRDWSSDVCSSDLRAQETADDVDREHALQPLDRHVFDARAQIDHAGVVDQRRYAPQGSLRLAEQADDVVFARDVGGHGNAANVLGELLRSRTLAAIVHAHCVAALRRQARSGRADAATAAGDDHHAAHLSAPAGTACR